MITPNPDSPESHLTSLGPIFLGALQLRATGKVDAALDAFKDLLLREPRLAEPRLEIGRIYLEMGRLDEAEIEAREAVRVLEAGGQWTEDLPENVVLALAWALLGEILKEQATTDEVVFGDAERFKSLLEQSKLAFQRAAQLDPSDASSFMNALELADESDPPEARELGDDLADEEADEPEGPVEFGEG